MKHAIATSLAALSIFAISLAHAQSQGMGGMAMNGDMKGMDMKSDKKAKSQTHKGSGTVSKVDPEKGRVTIAHGPIESMKWPAMTMTFKVTDKKLIAKVKQGEKVDFDFVNRGKDHVITRIQ